jgi:hypothetical protein
MLFCLDLGHFGTKSTWFYGPNWSALKILGHFAWYGANNYRPVTLVTHQKWGLIKLSLLN